MEIRLSHQAFPQTTRPLASVRTKKNKIIKLTKVKTNPKVKKSGKPAREWPPKRWRSVPRLPLEEEFEQVNKQLEQIQQNKVESSYFSPSSPSSTPRFFSSSSNFLSSKTKKRNIMIPEDKETKKRTRKLIRESAEQSTLSRELKEIEEKLEKTDSFQTGKAKIARVIPETHGHYRIGLLRKKRWQREKEKINRLLEKSEKQPSAFLGHLLPPQKSVRERLAEKKAVREVERISKIIEHGHPMPKNELLQIEEQLAALKSGVDIRSLRRVEKHDTIMKDKLVHLGKRVSSLKSGVDDNNKEFNWNTVEKRGKAGIEMKEAREHKPVVIFPKPPPPKEITKKSKEEAIEKSPEPSPKPSPKPKVIFPFFKRKKKGPFKEEEKEKVEEKEEVIKPKKKEGKEVKKKKKDKKKLSEKAKDKKEPQKPKFSLGNRITSSLKDKIPKRKVSKKKHLKFPGPPSSKPPQPPKFYVPKRRPRLPELPKPSKPPRLHELPEPPQPAKMSPFSKLKEKIGLKKKRKEAKEEKKIKGIKKKVKRSKDRENKTIKKKVTRPEIALSKISKSKTPEKKVSDLKSELETHAANLEKELKKN